MLYKNDNNIYVFANNKYYKLEVVKDNLVPTKQVEYDLKNKIEISKEDAMKILKKETSIKEVEKEIETKNTRTTKLTRNRMY